ncbi:acyl carrier protein [Streptomyces sp. NPDC048603]|uniref:acyl carrier protein n=1 Tax=Streptomyces sp. NPDC048603 TaxID=3365577 RepID=UPI0037150C25
MTTTQDLTSLVTDAYRETLGVDGLDENSDFYEWGGDSLTAFRITARLEEALGTEVPVALVFAYPTPADLAAVVESDLVRV